MIPKIHVSSQREDTKKHAHAPHINESDFMEAYNYLKIRDFDIMLECKDTNIALKQLKNNLKNNNIYL